MLIIKVVITFYSSKWSWKVIDYEHLAPSPKHSFSINEMKIFLMENPTLKKLLLLFEGYWNSHPNISNNMVHSGPFQKIKQHYQIGTGLPFFVFYFLATFAENIVKNQLNLAKFKKSYDLTFFNFVKFSQFLLS